MVFLQKLKTRPNPDALGADDAEFLRQMFDTSAMGVIAAGESVRWDEIDEVEVALSPRAKGPAGWLVRKVVHGADRYHVGIYFGRNEAILPNVSLDAARYAVQCVAYYSPLPVRYSGVEGLFEVVEEDS